MSAECQGLELTWPLRDLRCIRRCMYVTSVSAVEDLLTKRTWSLTSAASTVVTTDSSSHIVTVVSLQYLVAQQIFLLSTVLRLIIMGSVRTVPQIVSSVLFSDVAHCHYFVSSHLSVFSDACQIFIHPTCHLAWQVQARLRQGSEIKMHFTRPDIGWVHVLIRKKFITIVNGFSKSQ